MKESPVSKPCLDTVFLKMSLQRHTTKDDGQFIKCRPLFRFTRPLSVLNGSRLPL